MCSYESPLFLNEIERTLKIKYTQVQNSTKEKAIPATVSYIIHRTLGNIFAIPSDLYFKMREYNIYLVNEVVKTK